MLFPLGEVIFAKVTAERLLAPRAVDGVGDGRKGRDRLVFAGVSEELHILKYCQ